MMYPVHFRVLSMFLFASVATAAYCQDNYEIQVYGSETVKKGSTMVELHSNYNLNGPNRSENGVVATRHAWHETLEVTHGWTDCFETGFYLFTSYRNDQGWNIVGTHVRPRWRAPESWKWPIGASISFEYGFQKREFSEDTSNFEMRPIIDKQIGKLYVAFNPAFEKSIVGENAGAGFAFSPNFKVSYDLSKIVTVGLEYYGSVGPVTDWDASSAQTHQLFPSIDLNLSEDWEFNFGVGFGLSSNSQSSQGTILKMIVGRRFKF